MGTISAAKADELVGGPWFKGYAKDVTVVEEKVKLASFDGNARGDLARGPEHVIFEQGLEVEGTFRLGSYHSIYVVLGALRAGAFEGGDACLVVTGSVTVDRYLLNFRNQGVLAFGSSKATEKLPSAKVLSCPLTLWHDRRAGAAHADGAGVGPRAGQRCGAGDSRQQSGPEPGVGRPDRARADTDFDSRAAC